MAKQVRVLAAKPDDLSSIPRTHSGKTDPVPKSVSSHLYTCALTCLTHAHTHTVGRINNFSKTKLYATVKRSHRCSVQRLKLCYFSDSMTAE